MARRRHLQVQPPSARTIRRAKGASGGSALETTHPKVIRYADRKSLLLGTALVSTLLLGAVVSPTPAAAVVTCAAVAPGPAPIFIDVGDSIDCVNTETRTGTGFAISLRSTGAGNAIDLNTMGTLSATRAGGVYTVSVRTYSGNNAITIVSNGDIDSTSTGSGTSLGVFAYSRSNNSAINIVNAGIISASTNGFADAILARTRGDNSGIKIVNTGDITADGQFISLGVYGLAEGASSSVEIVNSGAIVATGVGSRPTIGVSAFAQSANSFVGIVNTGDVIAIADSISAFGLYARADSAGSSVDIDNTGNIEALAQTTGDAHGVRVRSSAANSAVTIVNSGNLGATTDNGDAYGASARSLGVNSNLAVTNTGDLSATSVSANAYGIFTEAYGADSFLDISNSGRLTVRAAINAFGISAATRNDGEDLDISNSGAITVTGGTMAVGVRAVAYDPNSTLNVINSGAITANGAINNVGILAYTNVGSSPVTIVNSGDITAVGGVAAGIYSTTSGVYSPLSITNSGDITAVGSAGVGGRGVGIRASTVLGFSPLTIENSGDIIASGAVVDAIDARTHGPESPVRIVNSGASATVGTDADNIRAETQGAGSLISIVNSGVIETTGSDAANIRVTTSGVGSLISIVNNGGAIKTTGSDADSIVATTSGIGSPISIVNSGDITTTGFFARGLNATTDGAGSLLSIVNSGTITTTGSVANAIQGETNGADSFISIVNSGRISTNALGIYASALGTGSRNLLTNSGSLSAGSTGILAKSFAGTTIVNSGDISASSYFAIGVYGGAANIYNSGLITGFVQLDADDNFINQSGGVFEARLTSDFDAYGAGGTDLFRNEAGGTVHALNVNGQPTSFVNLERFENSGLISMVDGAADDSFTISNTPGGTDLDFVASGGSTLAVDAFLGGPGSTSDVFTIEGNVSGVTTVAVNNTSTQPGVFNSQGIRVVNVMGTTPKASNFVLADGPIDTGLFDYDLYFTPTGSGHWELRSFPGASAQALPKLLTASQDIWHQTSATWFDRTADLRVVLNGGGSPAYDAGTKSMAEPGGNGLTPGVWIKGGGSRLDRQGNATTKAYGNTYKYDLDNELDTIDLQMGVDMGKYDVLSQGDVLIFGVLGGFVGAGLDYDSLADTFNFSGGQVGAYATYLKDGLFVDTLLNVHLYEIDTPNFGFPDSLNATTVGLRTDAGYRFGSFTGGAFFEPLATIEVTWADIDGFNVGGNKVSFSDDANVRGRIGGRVGTTTQAWEGTMMEPFLIASLWGNLSDENSATLVSSGRTFQFNDDLQDVWGELSAGVNLFNFSQTTAVFAKVDYTFGEDVQGVGGKAGMRVAW